jgi:hypothetical protein
MRYILLERGQAPFEVDDPPYKWEGGFMKTTMEIPDSIFRRTD